MTKLWKSLGDEDIIPLFQPTQQWASEKLLEYGALWPARFSGSKIKKVVELRDAAMPAAGCAIYYFLTGEERQREAALRGWEFFRKYNRSAWPESNDPASPAGLFPCPEIGPEWRVGVNIGGIESGRCYNTLLTVWQLLQVAEILEHIQEDLGWWLEVVTYDGENHTFPVSVDAQGREMTNQTNAYVYNMIAAFAVAMWRVGYHSQTQEFMDIAEDMIAERILPRQFPDGYWNYGEARIGYPPEPVRDAREGHADNYHGLTLLKLSRLLHYDYWRRREDYCQALVKGAEYCTTFVDQNGMANPWPNLEAVRLGMTHAHRPVHESQAHLVLGLARIGHHLDRPDLVETASRMMNWWFHNRPVLLPFVGEGNPYYGYGDELTSQEYELTARQVLVLAWEGWHLRRVDPWTVELVHLAPGTQVQ